MTTKEKRRLYNKKYYKEHAEKAKAYAKEYRKNNKKVRKVWREKNGGTSVYENLGIACASCNSSKHTKTEEEYRKYMENKEINYAA
jgi:5-methylcytosine-specific restriction endonuclease McrA